MSWWRFWQGPVESDEERLAGLEAKAYRTLGELLKYMKEDTRGVKSAGLVDKMLVEALSEIEIEQSALGILHRDFDSFVLKGKVKMSWNWGAGKTWGEVGNELVGLLQDIFRRKRLWIESLREKWRMPSERMPTQMKIALTVMYAEELQRIAHELFTVLETLRTTDYKRYEQFDAEICRKLRVIHRAMDTSRHGSFEARARVAS